MTPQQIAMEFIGTFVFISVILFTGEAIPIAVALAAVIYLASPVENAGQFNPAVTLSVWLRGELESTEAVAHALTQLAAGFAAYQAGKWFGAFK